MHLDSWQRTVNQRSVTVSKFITPAIIAQAQAICSDPIHAVLLVSVLGGPDREIGLDDEPCRVAKTLRFHDHCLLDALLGFVDLHSHILPGIDDGSPDAATSMEMIQGLAALGFQTLCATPHQKDGQFMPSAEDITAAYKHTVAAAEEAQVDVAFVRAAENMWDSVFFDRLRTRTVPSYGDSAAFLVEFRVHELPMGLLDEIFKMRVHGLLPVIAHPERYQPLWKTPELVQRLAEQCALVVDLGAVAGYHGRKQAKVARMLLSKGLAHAAASDAHAVADVRMVAEGMAWIDKKLGRHTLERLLGEAPRQILEGRHPAG